MKNYLLGVFTAFTILTFTGLGWYWFCPEARRVYIKESNSSVILEMNLEEILAMPAPNSSIITIPQKSPTLAKPFEGF